MLICNDVQSSIRFYVDVLGFRVVGRMDDVGNSGWASLESGSTSLMLTSPSYYPPPKRRGSNPLTDTLQYFYTDDVLSLKHRIESKGVRVSDCVVRFYGMKEIEVHDPDGRILIFGQDTDESPTPER